MEARINNVAAYYAPAIGEQQTTVSWNNLPRTSWKSLSEQPLVIDLGKIVSLKGFTYAPLNEQAKPTMAYRYNFSTSLDGKNWKRILQHGEFSNIMHNPLPQTVQFEQEETARFIKLEATTPDDKPAIVEMEEIGITLVGHEATCQ